MMVNWIKNDIAVYLQNISAAISENNTEKANNALQDKDRVYDDFSLITQNIVALGSSISGADLTDIKSWTPEDYVDQEITESEEGNMAKNQKTLENQYHMVVARCKDLEEQMRIRQKQWDQREVESKTQKN